MIRDSQLLDFRFSCLGSRAQFDATENRLEALYLYFQPTWQILGLGFKACE
jgi:hypothetical protein